jgi:hypothetical protein
MSALTTHGQRATMPQPAIATDVHQALDVHLHTLAQVAFNFSLRFQNGTNPAQLIFTQISYASVEVDAGFLEHRI